LYFSGSEKSPSEPSKGQKQSGSKKGENFSVGHGFAQTEITRFFQFFFLFLSFIFYADKLVGKTSDDANETSNSLLVMPESSDKGPSKVPTNNRRSPNKNDQNKTVETEIPSRPSTPTFLEELDKLDFATAKARAASQLSERSAPKDDASDQFIQSAVNTVSGLVEVFFFFFSKIDNPSFGVGVKIFLHYY
jgi:hypothetical protein